ncbi:16S rRNA methyltransferase [Ruegeria sp. ANG-S4]|uniref:16S rRNA (guanine(527)-N(7))-methyltransferase RsmG n=1 Tax=Ruegeria sp. ANG-S4 TaxID=1577904 RepID=UPI00057D4734|nr:16S rRNA (guanine(527)-N(7))-methyltransferase RsmG [Ruegeria sp. ANG-S4]KIC40922.1 16S rRNA methyltransferase [Ruegeria sp. ANG-S4]
MTPDDCRALSDLNVSRETLQRLSKYVDLVQRWNPRINLVSRNSLDEIWTRHVLDSAQVFRCAPSADHWVDLGSGGGFPGMVCAIMAIEDSPETRFTLVESDQRKSAFLRTVVRETKANCRVLSKRIETLDALNADVVSARALADLRTLISFCDKHLNKSGIALLPKGENWKKEVSEARQEWKFQADPITSLTEPKAVILMVKGVTRG